MWLAFLQKPFWPPKLILKLDFMNFLNFLISLDPIIVNTTPETLWEIISKDSMLP